jgi:UDP-2-acetamido-3-amino-2,3-dideoxy-glucuronate N-acetyltransferase
VVKAGAIHETADVSDEAQVGEGTKIWHQAQIRENAIIGANCIIGKGVYIDFDVVIGNNVKIQNGASIYHGVTIEDGVFIGPDACLTNDKYPRAITPAGDLKQDQDWEVGHITVRYGASLGARVVVLPDVVVGKFAMVGAGAVVVRDVPDQGLVQGNPGRLVGFVCKCGRKLVQRHTAEDAVEMWCPPCQLACAIPASSIVQVKHDSDC